MPKRLMWQPLLAIVVVAGLVVNHLFLLNQPDDWASPLAMLDRLFDLGFICIFVLLAIGLGQVLLRWLAWRANTWVEQTVFAFGMGSGTLGLFLAYLGLVQGLYPIVLLGIFFGGWLLTRHAWSELLHGMYDEWCHRQPFIPFEKIILVVLLLLCLPIVLGALTPPTDVDALNYHLVAPQFFLREHAIVQVYNNTGMNYPLGIDMLYIFGLAAGTDIVSQLMHASFAFMLTLGLVSFATRDFSRMTGLMAAFVLLASPVVGLSASMPLLDLGLTLYEFLAFWAFWRWRATRQQQELVLVGFFLGAALATKYLAVLAVVIIMALILWESICSSPRRVRMWIANVVIVSFGTLMVALPWYLKNWVWLSSPIFPFFSGYYNLDRTVHISDGDATGLNGWIGLGLGSDLRALMLFPWNIYVNWQYFGSPLNRGGPTLYFLFLPLYLFVRKHSILNWLLVICTIRFGVWWIYTQNIRYLIAIFPFLSLIVAYVVVTLQSTPRRAVGRVLLTTSLILFGFAPLILQWGFLFVLRENALPFLSGQVSRAAYLDANLLSYPVTRFMNGNLSNARILAIGDQRIYYLKPFVDPDDAHANWLELVGVGKTADGIARYLHDLGFTHLWISEDDLTYFRTAWKLDGPGDQSAQVFDELRQKYLIQIYVDERGHVVYEIRQ